MTLDHNTMAMGAIRKDGKPKGKGGKAQGEEKGGKSGKGRRWEQRLDQSSKGGGEGNKGGEGQREKARATPRTGTRHRGVNVSRAVHSDIWPRYVSNGGII